MALSELTTLDMVSLVESGYIELRFVTTVFRDSEEIARTYDRRIIIPGQDISGEDPRVQAIAEATWTPSLIETAQAINAPKTFSCRA